MKRSTLRISCMSCPDYEGTFFEEKVKEELRELEERRARVEKIEKLAEQKELDETEALRELELLLSAEDRKLLDEQYAMQANKYA